MQIYLTNVTPFWAYLILRAVAGTVLRSSRLLATIEVALPKRLSAGKRSMKAAAAVDGYGSYPFKRFTSGTYCAGASKAQQPLQVERAG